MNTNNNMLDALGTGVENAKTAKQLQALLGYKSTRQVSSRIERLRYEGKLICSCNTGRYRGYFYPATYQEVSHFANSMYSRIRAIKRAVAPADNILKQNINQISLEDI